MALHLPEQHPSFQGVEVSENEQVSQVAWHRRWEGGEEAQAQAQALALPSLLLQLLPPPLLTLISSRAAAAVEEGQPVELVVQQPTQQLQVLYMAC